MFVQSHFRGARHQPPAGPRTTKTSISSQHDSGHRPKQQFAKTHHQATTSRVQDSILDKRSRFATAVSQSSSSGDNNPLVGQIDAAQQYLAGAELYWSNGREFEGNNSTKTRADRIAAERKSTWLVANGNRRESSHCSVQFSGEIADKQSAQEKSSRQAETNQSSSTKTNSKRNKPRRQQPPQSTQDNSSDCAPNSSEQLGRFAQIQLQKQLNLLINSQAECCFCQFSGKSPFVVFETLAATKPNSRRLFANGNSNCNSTTTTTTTTIGSSQLIEKQSRKFATKIEPDDAKEKAEETTKKAEEREREEASERRKDNLKLHLHLVRSLLEFVGLLQLAKSPASSAAAAADHQKRQFLQLDQLNLIRLGNQLSTINNLLCQSRRGVEFVFQFCSNFLAFQLETWRQLLGANLLVDHHHQPVAAISSTTNRRLSRQYSISDSTQNLAGQSMSNPSGQPIQPMSYDGCDCDDCLSSRQQQLMANSLGHQHHAHTHAHRTPTPGSPMQRLHRITNFTHSRPQGMLSPQRQAAITRRVSPLRLQQTTDLAPPQSSWLRNLETTNKFLRHTVDGSSMGGDALEATSPAAHLTVDWYRRQQLAGSSHNNSPVRAQAHASRSSPTLTQHCRRNTADNEHGESNPSALSSYCFNSLDDRGGQYKRHVGEANANFTSPITSPRHQPLHDTRAQTRDWLTSSSRYLASAEADEQPTGHDLAEDNTSQSDYHHHHHRHYHWHSADGTRSVEHSEIVRHDEIDHIDSAGAGARPHLNGHQRSVETSPGERESSTSKQQQHHLLAPTYSGSKVTSTSWLSKGLQTISRKQHYKARSVEATAPTNERQQPNKVSLTGARRRLGFKRKNASGGQLATLIVHRSEEISPSPSRHAQSLQTADYYDYSQEADDCSLNLSAESYTNSSSLITANSHVNTGHSNTSHDQQSNESKVRFVDGLGVGQIASRQALVSPYLGDIQLSMSDQRGMLEVEVIRARSLRPKPCAKRLPSPYVKVYLMREKKCIAKFKTVKLNATLDPLFQQRFILRDSYANCILQVIVWADYGQKDRKSLMGLVQIHLDHVDISNVLVGWYKLVNVPSMACVGSSLKLSSKSLRQTISSAKCEELEHLAREAALENLDEKMYRKLVNSIENFAD